MDDDDPTSPHLVTTLLPSLDPLKAASGAANNCRSEALSVNSQNTLVFFCFFYTQVLMWSQVELLQDFMEEFYFFLFLK